MSFVLSPPPPVPWAIFPDNHDFRGEGAAVLTANTVYYSDATVRGVCLLTGFRVRFGAGAGGANLYDVGLYDLNANLLTHTGQIATATGKQSPTLATPYQVNPGKYYLVFWINNAVDTVYSAGIANFLNMDAFGTSASGLPANLSSLTSVSTGTRVGMIGLVQGGWN